MKGAESTESLFSMESECMLLVLRGPLIRAKSDPRAERWLRWVKVVSATYNGGSDLPPRHFNRGSSQSHRAVAVAGRAAVALGLEMSF